MTASTRGRGSRQPSTARAFSWTPPPGLSMFCRGIRFDNDQEIIIGQVGERVKSL